MCDSDDDGDKLDDGFDNCPTVYNLDRGVDRNGDGFVNQQDQEDYDRDGIGTACDPDEARVGGPGGSTDTRAPRLAVSVERRVRLAAARAGLVVKMRCSEACGTTAELAVPRPVARRLGLRTRILAGGSASLEGAGVTYVFVRFDRRARRSLFRMDRLRSTLTTTAVDGGGNRRRVTRRIGLVR